LKDEEEGGEGVMGKEEDGDHDDDYGGDTNPEAGYMPELGPTIEISEAKVKRSKYTYFAGFRSSLVYPVGRAVDKPDLLTRLTEVSNEAGNASHASHAPPARSRQANQSSDSIPYMLADDAAGAVPPTTPHISQESGEGMANTSPYNAMWYVI